LNTGFTRRYTCIQFTPQCFIRRKYLLNISLRWNYKSVILLVSSTLPLIGNTSRLRRLADEGLNVLVYCPFTCYRQRWK
jgi:hypothetical protein